MQVTNATIGYLKDEDGELSDHLINIDQEDIFDPNLNIAAGVRWLFQKRRLASAKLGRQATWEEAVAEYKAYLRRKKNWKEATGIERFFGALKELEKK
jgi:hypothetical protein